MRILMVFSYAPLPPPRDLGGMKRNIPFFLQNAKRHTVSVLAFGSADEEASFRAAYGSLCSQIVFVPRPRRRVRDSLKAIWLLLTGRSLFGLLYRTEMQRAIDSLTIQERFDLVHCCVQMLGCFEFPAGIPSVTDTHEVTYDLYRRVASTTPNIFRKVVMGWLSHVARPEEIRLCKKFRAVIATTDRDRALWAEDLPAAGLFTVNNGVDPSFFEPPGMVEEPGAMVFTGKMSYYPNDHGIHFFIDEILPRIRAELPRAKLYVVGTEPSRSLLQRASDSVTVTGFVEDVRPYIARSEVFVIPLMIGGGIRGKALEAMAMKKAIVSTTIGCEGINLRHRTSAMFADTAATFADAVVRVLKDSELRRRLGEEAWATVRREYDWDVQGQRLDEVYRRVVGMRDHRAREAGAGM